MMASAEPYDEAVVERDLGGLGRTVVHEGELLRHPTYTRFLHWTVAIFFFAALLSGLAIYAPWSFSWLTPLFGGGQMTRLLHPWFGIAFVVAWFFQFLNWLGIMAWTEADSRWLRGINRYVKNDEKVEPEYVGFFNGGQKLQFWEIAFGGLVLLITGLLMWFPEVSGRIGVAISYPLHDIAALIMLAGIFIHIYLSTIGQPGTLRSMTQGVVTRAWAWTHHPAWYGRVTGRNPREDYDAARRRQAERAREMTSLRREDNRPVTKPEPSKSPD
ncbi:MAG TPA: formate dehydrogenase subunit gamma [Blastocatellia bacterium]|nr:formate dehydrogenase subunit gamma [Blastocatellia bacterium]